MKTAIVPIARNSDEVILTDDDHESIVTVLRDPPAGLAELHAELLSDHSY